MNKALESCIIVSIGFTMHLNRLSIIELQTSKLSLLTPNAASSLFVFSVLCIFSKLRLLWPQNLRKSQKFLLFLGELALILYATEFLLRHIWLPSLKLLSFVCHFLGQYVLKANQNFIIYNKPKLSGWIRYDAFYIARFLLAVVVFIFMLHAIGVMASIKDKFCCHNKALENLIAEQASNDARQRKQRVRKTKRNSNKILLNDAHNESDC